MRLTDDSTLLACLNCDAGPFDATPERCPSCDADHALVWADHFARLPSRGLVFHERS